MKDNEPKTTENEADSGRRSVFAALLGLGIAGVAGCGNVTSKDQEVLDQTNAALSGAAATVVVTWVDTVLGPAFLSSGGVTRDGDLATKTSSALDPTNKTVVAIAKGCCAAGDAGGGVFYWEASSSTGDDGGIIIVPSGSATGRWRRIYSGPIDVRWFGAFGDGTSYTPGIQKAINASATRGGGPVFIPPSPAPYFVSTTLLLPSYVNVVGAGLGSELRASLSGGSTPNFFVFSFASGCVFATVANLAISASHPQTSGGGFDYTLAAQNITVSDIVVQSNICTTFNVVPTSSPSGVYTIERIRWNGGAGYVNGIYIGDGVHALASIVIRDCSGTAGGGALPTWVTINNLTDSVFLTNFGVQYGGTGIVIGGLGGAPVTGVSLVNVVIDGMSSFGINVANAENLHMSGCRVNTCGSSTAPGVNIGQNCNTLRMDGSTVMNCQGHGIQLQYGSSETLISNCVIANNGQSAGGPFYGIAVTANTTNFVITGNVIGSSSIANHDTAHFPNPGNVNQPAPGHQQNSIYVGGGTSNNYIIAMNRLEDGSPALIDGGTGTNKVVTPNI